MSAVEGATPAWLRVLGMIGAAVLGLLTAAVTYAALIVLGG